MHPDMLHLAERLVIAMETMSQDVKNMSAYVYDISCSVSYLLNEKREKECILVEACDESDYPPNVTSAAAEKASAESVDSGRYEQADDPSSHIADPEHGESSFGYVAPMSIAPHDHSDVLSSESNPIVTGGIKVEEPYDVEENDESRDVDNMCGVSRSNSGILEEMKYERQWETEEEDQACDLHTTISHSVGQLTPSSLLETTEPASGHVWQNIQRAVTSSNSSLNTILEEMKYERQWETEEEDQTCDLHTTISHSVGQLTPSSLLETTEPASGHVWQNIQRAVTSSNSSLNSAGTAFVSRIPAAEISVARTHQMESVEETSVVHAKGHSEEGSYKCSFCEKSFKWPSELKRHTRVHTGERPYKCNICGRAFSHKAALKPHMRTHTGERPCRCVVCGYSFRERHHLNDHMRVHTGENPYKCNLCGKAFRQNPTFNRHMRSHYRQYSN